MKKLITLAVAMGLAFGGMTAHADERTQQIIETRQGLLKLLGYYIGPIVGMARQQVDYDADLVAANAEKIAGLAPLIVDVFQHDTSASDIESESLDGIWENLDDFNGKAATLAERASALAAATAEGQGAAMKAFGGMGAACKSCHDDYRLQN